MPLTHVRAANLLDLLPHAFWIPADACQQQNESRAWA